MRWPFKLDNDNRLWVLSHILKTDIHVDTDGEYSSLPWWICYTKEQTLYHALDYYLRLEASMS